MPIWSVPKRALVRRWIHLAYLLPLAYLLWPLLWKPLDHRFYNYCHANRQPPAWEHVAVVDIDVATVDKLLVPPALPLSRHVTHHAALVEALNAAGARAIVLDLALQDDMFDVPPEALVDAMREAGNVYLVATRTLSASDQGRHKTSDLRFNVPSPDLTAVAKGIFATDTQIDADGVLRRYRRLDRLELFGLKDLGEEFAGIETTGAVPIEFPSLDDPIVTVPYHRALEGGDALAGMVADKIVFVGSSLEDSRDFVVVPTLNSTAAGEYTLPGVTVFAAITETLIQGARLRDAPWLVTLAWILFWSMLLGVVISSRRPIRSAAIMLLIVIAAAVTSSLLHIFGNIVLPTGLVVSALVVVALHTTVYSHRNTTKELIRTLSNAKEELEIKVDERTRELRTTQAHLVQSEKMASLGNVAANVAHLINNPIGAVTSAADTAQRCLTKVDAALAEAERNPQLDKPINVLKQTNQLIVESAGTVAKFVRSLREFTGHDMAAVRTVNLNDALDHTVTVMAYAMAGVEVERDYGELPPVTCYASELNQAFLNVLHNGVRALEGAGTIAIKTSANNGLVQVEIKDNGVGIREEDLGRVFELGFTRWGGTQTGHGLSAALEIVERHRGKIRVESELGAGSTFTFVIPTALAETDDTKNGEAS